MKLLTILGIVACLGVLVVGAPVIGAPAPPGPTQVTVTNTPLPVTGTVNATIPGNVNATVTGEVTASVPDGVTITNTLANAVPVTVQSMPAVSVSTGYHFIGQSQSERLGNVSLPVLNQDCQDAYAGVAGARLCTTREFLTSIIPPGPPFATGWVQPDYITAYNPPAWNSPLTVVLVDFSGISFSYNLVGWFPGGGNCQSWLSKASDYYGLMASSGPQYVTLTPCGSSLHACCCAP